MRKFVTPAQQLLRFVHILVTAAIVITVARAAYVVWFVL